MVRHREIEVEQLQDGADQPLGLAQRQAEHGPQGQRRCDRQAGVARLTAPAGARLSSPGRASGVNHTVRLPRARRPASYAAQLMTRCCCFGMWRRHAVADLVRLLGPLRATKRGPDTGSAPPITPNGKRPVRVRRETAAPTSLAMITISDFWRRSNSRDTLKKAENATVGTAKLLISHNLESASRNFSVCP